jgi:AcrR family transcriptional regulator
MQKTKRKAPAKTNGGARGGLKKPAQKRLGRRPGKSLTQDEILDAAEKAFAANGYLGTSLREIARSAKVNQALVHHYFGTKEKLFQAIFLRRGLELAKRRLERLETLEAKRNTPPEIEEIVEAYIAPAYELKKQGPGGIAFMRLQSRVHIEPKSVPDELRNAVYDQAMRQYISAFSRALPELDAESVFWRMIFSIGAYLYTISDANRIAQISEGLCDPADLDSSFRQLSSFISGGLRGAPAQPQSWPQVDRKKLIT